MNRYVDIYTNILPTMDTVGNGAPTQEQAVRRLAQSEQNCIKTVIAAPLYTPETYASPDEFFEKRREICLALNAESAKLAHPVRVQEGVILQYSSDLLRLGDKLKRFSLADSRYMLLDLPIGHLDANFYDDMTKLQVVSGLTPILADFDRFYSMFTLEDYIPLREAGILLQISADGLIAPEKRKLSLYLLANQRAHFVASGSQSPESPVRLGEAMRIVQRSLPSDLYRRIKNNAGMLLSDAAPSEFL